MKSVKPGRGPSMMNGISSIGIAVFGVLWIAVALSMGAGLFALFGVVFVFIAAAQAVYSFKNAVSEERYSEFDIADSTEEGDPLNRRFGIQSAEDGKAIESTAFCPYCGKSVQPDFAFCSGCGRELPKK